MKRLLSFVLIVMALGACRGCENSSNNTNTNPVEACSDLDGDGFFVGADCEDDVLDCNDLAADVNPDAEDVCGDGVDNDCDNQIDQDCLVEGPCVEDAVRECGNDTGACEVGTQTCQDGEWTDCTGIGPTSETCNGVDDDCDGEVDERGEQLCDDGLVCNGVSVCENGTCTVPEPPDCEALSGPCAEGRCSEKDRGCRVFPAKTGSSCDDGNFCTDNGTCVAGVCETEPRDCSSAGDSCNVGICDEEADACVSQPVSDGTSCDDGAFCTIGDTCMSGTCTGAARDCSSLADQCNAGACDEVADACVPSPVADGTACDDGLYCNVGEACVAGACTGGAVRDCSALGGSCRTGICNEATDACDGPPVADGTACDDNQFCTINDSCVAGTCTGGGARDCSAVAGLCQSDSCDDTLNQCVATSAPDGTACDDGLFCTVGEICMGGMCSGTQRNCDVAADACNAGTCVEAMDACVPTPLSDGTNCPDNLYCTVNEVCQAGSCNSAPRTCNSQTDQCNTGVCDDTADACIADPLPNSTGCDDGLFCTQNDTCFNGSCAAGPPRDCSAATGGDMCYDGLCDEISGCIAIDNGTCDLCADSRPTADAGDDRTAVPNELVMLDGTGSTDPMGQSLTYRWRVASRPPNSSSPLFAPGTANPSIITDVSGDFVLCLEVTDSEGCVSTEDCVTVTVSPLVDLHIELTWDTDVSDLDLHYMAPVYDVNRWFGTSGVVWWQVSNPDWGGGVNGDQSDGIPTNDPVLDVDNTTGFGPENINQNNLFDGSPFTIGVHYFINSDTSFGPVTSGPVEAQIRVFESGAVIYQATRSLNCRDFWEVGEIQISGAGTNVNVTAKNTVTNLTDEGHCRCNSNADCPGSETCTRVIFQGLGPVDVCR